MHFNLQICLYKSETWSKVYKIVFGVISKQAPCTFRIIILQFCNVVSCYSADGYLPTTFNDNK